MDAYTSALRILRYRFNSERELRRKLSAKRFDEGEIDGAISRLRAENWIDDERFAGAFVRTRAARKIGPSRIRRELGAAGVERETIDRALAENIDDQRTSDDLAEAAAKRRRVLVRKHGADYVSSSEGKMKLAAYLVKQGYSHESVREVVRHDDD